MSKSLSFRKIGTYSLLFIAAIVLTGGPVLRAQKVRIKIAVVGLSNPSTLQKSNIGNSLVDILDSQISTVGKYTLLERAQLEDLKKELDLGESGLANAKTFAQKGGLTGADFLLFGKVSDYTYKENVMRKSRFVLGAGIQQVLYYDHIGHVRVDLRLVDVKTGQDVRSISGEGTAHATGSVSYQNEWYLYISREGQGTLTNLRSLLTEASHRAIEDAVNKLNDMEPDLEAFLANRSVNSELSSVGGGKILAVLGQGQFVIGVPNTSALRVGDRFKVIAEVPLKNAQGIVVYKEKRNVGMLQITNISESNRALASIVNSGSSPTAGTSPAEGDTLVFDRAYGKTLRGMGAPAAAGAGSSSGAESAGSSREISTYISRGDRFMDQQDYSEALDQYRQALRLKPASGKILAKKSLAEVEVGDLDDAEGDAEKAVQDGGAVKIPVIHLHTFGHSDGNLVIEKGKVAFQPDSGNDGFSVESKRQISTDEGKYPFTNVPELVIHYSSSNGKRHKDYMVIPMFLTRNNHTVGFPYRADNGAADKTTHLDEMVIRLINESLP